MHEKKMRLRYEAVRLQELTNNKDVCSDAVQ